MVLIIIIIGSLMISIDTFINSSATSGIHYELQKIFNYFDVCLNYIFLIEFLIKSIAQGFLLDQGSYLRDNWNKLDFFIVSTSLFNMYFKTYEFEVFKVNFLNF